ncbi:DUF6053 domain-containing protein [Lysobacter enzymogenes]|uniref:DUF6053 domain-containing protein n=1 Tax=Lysobacter enzymogenes TaxID=69 RepID=UPI003D18DCDE
MGGASAPTPLCPIAANRAESIGPEGLPTQAEKPRARRPCLAKPKTPLACPLRPPYRVDSFRFRAAQANRLLTYRP